MTDHVYIRHMQGAPRDCSMFKSNDVEEVNDIMNETVNYPDKIKAHRSDINRIVYIKKFKKVVGLHGVTKKECKKVLVIGSKTDNSIITAFPML